LAPFAQGIGIILPPMLFGVVSPAALILSGLGVLQVAAVWFYRNRPDAQPKMRGMIVRGIIFVGLGMGAQMLATR
jgi:hypothetical protein